MSQRDTTGRDLNTTRDNAARDASAPGLRRHDLPGMISPALRHQLPPHQPPPAGIDVGLLMRTLRRRIPVLVAMAIAGGALGLGVQHEMKPRYTSSVSVLLEPKRADSFGADTQFGSMYVDGTMIASVVSVIVSSDLLDRVVAAEHLDALPEFGDANPSLLRRLVNQVPFLADAPPGNTEADRRARAVWKLSQAIKVERVGATYVLTIDAVASSPDLARRIAAGVADLYLGDQVERKSAETQRDSTWIDDRLASVRHDLQQSEDALDAVRRKYGLQETTLSSGATLDRQVLTDLSMQLTAAQTEVANARVRYDQVSRARTGGGALEGLPEVDSSPVIGELRGKVSETSKQLTALQAVYGDNYPDVRRLQNAQRTLQAQLGAEVGRIVERRRLDYEGATGREQALEDQIKRANTPIAGTVAGEGHEQLRDAQRIVDANRGLYDSLLIRWREVQQQQTRETPEARIISQASTPDKPSFPKPLLFPAGGAALFLILGFGLTLLPAMLDRRFVSITAVEQRLGLSVLGAVPMLGKRDLRAKNREQSLFEYPSAQPLSRFAESLRMLRAYLRVSADGASSIVQVTSAVAGEGKSTVAAALAVSAASAGIRTVLVDADVRSSSVSAMFGLRGEAGLTDVLERGTPVRAALREIGGTPLAVLGGGSSDQPRPDLIHSSGFAAMLRDLSESYSLVILDGPPVLPVSDALVMSRYADATILVVEWRATARDHAEQAAKALRMVGAPLAGVIVNKIDLSKVSQYEHAYPA